MLQLIIKDLILVKKLSKWVFAWSIFIGYSMLNKEINPLAFSIISFIFAAFLIRNSLLLDDQNHTDDLYCSLPINRSAIVLARYLSAFILTLVLIVMLFCIANARFPSTIKVTTAFFNFFCVATFFSVFFPFYFKFGSEIRKDIGSMFIALIMLLLLIVLFGLIVYVYGISEAKILENPHIHLYLIILLVVMVISSMFLSIKIYRKREF
jgi:hypothetical protein